MSSNAPTGTTEPSMPKSAEPLFEQHFLEAAKAPDAEARIEAELGDKLERIEHGHGERNAQLRALAAQAAALWARRKQLDRTQMVYLGAALLYFISPVDAVPDVIPGLGYLDDIAVLSAIIAMVLKGLDQARQKVESLRQQTVDEVTDKLVDKGRVALDELVEQRADALFSRFDDSAAEAVDNSVTALVISLWGMTTAAAVSLALAILLGGFSGAWLIYVGLSTVVVFAWNLIVGLDYWREYRKLSGPWQRRVRDVIAAKLGWRHALAVGLPVLVLLGLGVTRLLV